MNRDSNDKGPRSAADQLHSGDQLNSNQADKDSKDTNVWSRSIFHFATRIWVLWKDRQTATASVDCTEGQLL